MTSVSLTLDFGGLNNVRAALNALDGYDVAVPGVQNGPKIIRAPFQLGGATRRLISKNLATLSTAIEIYTEGQRALWKECFPDVPEGTQVERDEAPAGYDRFQKETVTLFSAKEQVALEPLSAKVLFADNIELPTAATTILQIHDLIAD